MRHQWAGGVGLAALALGLATPAVVAAQQTTASVTGVAVDDKGAPLADATITVTHLPSGTRQTTKTDSHGAFAALGLRVGGPYTILAAHNGFAEQTLSDIYLSVGDVEHVRLALAPSNEVSELVVTATRRDTTAQLANVGTRTTLHAEQIDAVVTVKRDIRDLGRRDPLANLDLVNRGTGPSGGLYIAGSSPRRNRITIDGVRDQDDFGLNTGGLSTNRGPVSLEAIEVASVQAVPFDVVDGDFTGGSINMILKSGGNSFHGTLFGFYRNNDLVGTHVPNVAFVRGNLLNGPVGGDLTTVPYIHERNYGAFLSGPIFRDKLFFAISYEDYESNDLTSTGPAGAGFANLFNRIPGSANANATLGDINGILSDWNAYAASKNLAPGAIELARPIKDEKYSVKLDWNISDNDRLTITYRHAFSSVTKRTETSTGISMDTNWYVQPETVDNYAAQLNSTWSPTLSTEARVSYRTYIRGQNPPEGQNFGQVTICTDQTDIGSPNSCSSGVPQIFFGPDQFRQANQLNTRDWAGEATAFWRWNPDNLLKVGYQFKGIDVFDLFVQAAHGVYYFDSVADFSAGKANSLRYGGSLDGKLNDAAERFNYQVHTLLGQNTWNPTQDLTINGGLRIDIYAQNDKPTLNPNFVTRYGFSNQKNYDGEVVVMPRLSAKWSQGDIQISGGVGRFSGGIPDVFIGNNYGAQTGAVTNSFNIVRQSNGTFLDTASGATIDQGTGAALLSNLTANAGFINSASPAVTALIQTPSMAQRNTWTNSWAPNFSVPADWKLNLAFRANRWHATWGLDFVYSFSDTNVAFRDLRARPLTINGVQQYTPDGRIRYDGLVFVNQPGGLTAAQQRAALGLPVSSNPDLINIGSFGDIQAYNPGKQNWVATLALSADWAPVHGLDAFVSYTYQQGKSFGGISEFGTTEGGNAATGNFYADQTSSTDPNTAAYGRAPNVIEHSFKLDLSYKFELVKGWPTRLTLFGEYHSGRPINFIMTDPSNAQGARSPTFGVFRDDQLAYIPNLNNPDPTNPLKFVTNGTAVYFANPTALAQFQALVNQFHLPMGGIVPKGYGQNPWISRFDFQFEQDIPAPGPGHLEFTTDISNLGNLLNKHWGVVREYTNARNGGIVVNAQCATAAGVPAGNASPVCASYLYSYTTANATTLATPTVDPVATQWTVELGLKYRF